MIGIPDGDEVFVFILTLLKYVGDPEKMSLVLSFAVHRIVRTVSWNLRSTMCVIGFITTVQPAICWIAFSKFPLLLLSDSHLIAFDCSWYVTRNVRGPKAQLLAL